MPSLFSRLKGRDGKGKKKGGLDDLANQQPQKPRWDDAWTRKTIEPEEVHELIRYCTQELKARGMTYNLDPAAAAHYIHGANAPGASPVPQPQANGTLQHSISHSFYSRSARHPTRAQSVLSYDTISTAKMAVCWFAGRVWRKKCA